MRRLLLQAIFLTFGLIANLYIVGDVSAELVCGALLAICCAAVGEYARSSAWTIAILLMLDCGACFTPSWCAMMPVAAYNAAMLPAVSQNVEQHRAGRNHAGLRSQLPNMPQYDAMQITLPVECEEETMKEIIMDIQDETPREISRGILERALGYSDYHARDDMTVLVANVVRK